MRMPRRSARARSTNVRQNSRVLTSKADPAIYGVRRRVDQTLDDGTGQRRSIAVGCNRHCDGLGAGARQQVALPSADEADMTFLGPCRSAIATVGDSIEKNGARL